MKKIILFNFLFSYMIFAQQHEDFYYERIVKLDGFIVKIESYDSKTGVYNRTKCYLNDSSKEEIIIPITKNEKNDIWKLRKEFGKFVYGECTNNKNVTLISNFYFENEKLPPKCIETNQQREQFIKLSMGLRLLLESKPEYKKAFYWEFIKK